MSESAEEARTRQTSIVADLAVIKQDIKGLHDCVDGMRDGLDAFKTSIGLIVERHGEKIIVLETHVGLLLKISWILFATSMGAVVAALFKVLLK